MAEDDFRRWEHELHQGAEEEASDGRPLVIATAAVAAGCALLIAMGNVPLGVAGLVLASIIVLLWRIGM